MKGLTTKQVAAVFQDFGFQQVEAAGLFSFYEAPTRSDVREFDLPVYVRAMFYEGRSEVQIWMVLAWKGGRGQMHDDGSAVAHSQGELATLIQRMVHQRQEFAVRELVRVHDHRLSQFRDLVAAAEHDRDAVLVLADALMERGVPF